jgi:hypothetical protein
MEPTARSATLVDRWEARIETVAQLEIAREEDVDGRYSAFRLKEMPPGIAAMLNTRLRSCFYIDVSGRSLGREHFASTGHHL